MNVNKCNFWTPSFSCHHLRLLSWSLPLIAIVTQRFHFQYCETLNHIWNEIVDLPVLWFYWESVPHFYCALGIVPNRFQRWIFLSICGKVYSAVARFPTRRQGNQTCENVSHLLLHLFLKTFPLVSSFEDPAWMVHHWSYWMHVWWLRAINWQLCTCSSVLMRG